MVAATSFAYRAGMLLASGFVTVALAMMFAGVSLAVGGSLVLRATSTDPGLEDQGGCATRMVGGVFLVTGALLIVMGILIFGFEPH